MAKRRKGIGAGSKRKEGRKRRNDFGFGDIGLLFLIIAAACAFAYVLLLPDGRMTVYLSDKGKTTQYKALENTVGGFLTEVGVTTGPEDSISPAPDAPLTEGMTIDITRTYPVSVHSGGMSHVVRMSHGTVGDALEKAGVIRKSGDELSMLPFEDIKPGMKINHTAVDVSYAISYKTLDYDEVIKKDSGKYESFKEVEQEGKDGKKRVTQRIIVKDGVEVSREVVDQIVTEEAVDKIIRVGTKIRYQTNLTGETRRWKEAPKDGVNGWKSMKVDKITAYCTNGRTASGTHTKLGTIAVNPKYFKYGTQIYVPGYGFGVARDTGAFRNYTNSSGKPMNQLDLWMSLRSECMKWGTKYNVTIWYK